MESARFPPGLQAEPNGEGERKGGDDQLKDGTIEGEMQAHPWSSPTGKQSLV
jgi:hypothetical protein